MTAAGTAQRTDRVLPLTRWVSIVVIPFLIAAVILLYILASQTEQLFAWTIDPPLTAMFLASAYVGGIWFFAQVLRLRMWHRVAYGFPAVVVFAALLAASTLLHWERFHHGHPSFIAWLTLYLTTPVVALVAYLMNRREDTGAPEARDYVIPLVWRVVLGLIGLAALVTGLLMFFIPTLLQPLWAWPLTPLTTRVVGAILTLPGMVNLWLLRDTRWSSFRWMFQAQIVSLLFLTLAVLLRAQDLDWTRPAALLFVLGIELSLVIYLAFYLSCETQLRRLRRPAPA
ncbi:hypothetical protein [Salinibacterium sp. ZJ450]|uniref:hypothetical protein n=1 Tax=Salinibacterium sp. ZJ450 TaxID=2708338 RepID=UPI001422844E|nr:hypothetical protein [Salinibacterium sp. ZJ450]